MSAVHNPGDSRLRRWLHVGFCAAVLFFLVAPVLVVIPLSFNAEPYFTFTEGMLRLEPDAWSLRWYENVLGEGRWLPALGKSLVIGIAATLVSTTLGTLAALGLSSPAMPGRGLIMAVLISPMVTPIIITAAGMSFFYSDLGLGQTYTALILAHAVLGAPFVLIAVSASLSGYNHDLNRAAANLGADGWTTLRRVQLPLIAPGVFTGALFAFSASFDEVVVVLFIGGPEQRTIPREMWAGIREQISPEILAVATFLIVFAILLLAAVNWLRQRDYVRAS
ncbi:MAG: ABC transporter permease [Gammaproteobacteria bacterium]|nr:ABC transporter permease [Gammaproteobacteria bacterium]MXZ33023.1 ABC transporter permease [Gammaproteobacteria bacterium]MYF01109.1 ABC transporter permease [Gammaproteobacteria bacterium]MYG97562.1 ABC transporter permease [Gammaproteobacteria bacterium]